MEFDLLRYIRQLHCSWLAEVVSFGAVEQSFKINKEEFIEVLLWV
jgi:hypothetical protein